MCMGKCVKCAGKCGYEKIRGCGNNVGGAGG